MSCRKTQEFENGLFDWVQIDPDSEQISGQIFATGCFCFSWGNLSLRGHLWEIKSHLIIWGVGLWHVHHLRCQSPQIHSSLHPFHPFPSLPPFPLFCTWLECFCNCFQLVCLWEDKGKQYCSFGNCIFPICGCTQGWTLQDEMFDCLLILDSSKAYTLSIEQLPQLFNIMSNLT